MTVDLGTHRHPPFENDVALYDALAADTQASPAVALLASTKTSATWLSDCCDPKTGIHRSTGLLSSNLRAASSIKQSLARYSYRNKLTHDLGLKLADQGTSIPYPFRMWDGRYFHLKPEDANSHATPASAVECTADSTRGSTTLTATAHPILIPADAVMHPVMVTSNMRNTSVRITALAKWRPPTPAAPTSRLNSELHLSEDSMELMELLITKHFTNTSASPGQPTGQSAAEKLLWRMKRTKTQTTGDSLCITSDGSYTQHAKRRAGAVVRQANCGTYAWAVHPMGPDFDCEGKAEFIDDTLAHGGGQHAAPEADPDDPNPSLTSSTRLEACAILDALCFLNTTSLRTREPAPSTPPILWVCDSKPAISTLHKLLTLTTRQLMMLPNKDIWTAIKNEVGGSNVSHHIKLVWTKSHADSPGVSYSSLSFAQKCNVLADNLCEGYYTSDGPQRLTLRSKSGSLSAGGHEITTSVTPFVRDHARFERTKLYFQDKSHIWGKLDDIAWASMRQASKGMHFTNRIVAMKGMHGLFADNHIKLLRGLVDTTKVTCELCKLCTEDNWHRTGMCTAECAVKIRQECLEKIASDITATKAGDTGDMAKQTLELLQLNDDGSVKHYLRTEPHADEAALFPNGTRPMWHMVVPTPARDFITNVVSNNTVDITRIIVSAMRQMQLKMWQCRVAILAESGPPVPYH